MSSCIDPTMPFLTTFRENPDYDDQDSQKEIELLFQRQQMIDQLLTGNIPVDELLDCLNDQDYDVDDYVDTVVSNIEYHIENDMNRFADPDDLSFFRDSLCQTATMS